MRRMITTLSLAALLLGTSGLTPASAQDTVLNCDVIQITGYTCSKQEDGTIVLAPEMTETTETVTVLGVPPSEETLYEATPLSTVTEETPAPAPTATPSPAPAETPTPVPAPAQAETVPMTVEMARTWCVDEDEALKASCQARWMLLRDYPGESPNAVGVFLNPGAAVQIMYPLGVVVDNYDNAASWTHQGNGTVILSGQATVRPGAMQSATVPVATQEPAAPAPAEPVEAASGCPKTKVEAAALFDKYSVTDGPNENLLADPGNWEVGEKGLEFTGSHAVEFPIPPHFIAISGNEVIKDEGMVNDDSFTLVCMG